MCPFFNRRWKKCVTLSNQKTETTSWSKTWVISLARGLQLLVLLLLLLLLLRIRVRGIVTIASECWVLPYSQLLSHSDSSSWAPLMDKSREAERLNGLPKVTSSVLECPDKFSAFILFFHSCCLPIYQVSQHFTSTVPHSALLLSYTSWTLTFRSMALTVSSPDTPTLPWLPFSMPVKIPVTYALLS